MTPVECDPHQHQGVPGPASLWTHCGSDWIHGWAECWLFSFFFVLKMKQGIINNTLSNTFLKKEQKRSNHFLKKLSDASHCYNLPSDLICKLLIRGCNGSQNSRLDLHHGFWNRVRISKKRLNLKMCCFWSVCSHRHRCFASSII